MNGFICIKGSKSDIPSGDIVKCFRGQSYVLDSYSFDEKTINLYSFNHDEVISGRAENNRYLLVLSGFLQFPLPEWDGKSPLDSARLAAEYLLERFNKYKYKFLNGVFGSYALVVLDKRNGDIYAATDSEGHRRLFYSENDRVFNLATHINIMSWQVDIKHLNHIDEAFFLSYEFLPERKTIYPQIKYFQADKIAYHHHDLQLYNRVNVEKNIETIAIPSDENDLIDLLYSEFMDAVRRLLPSEKKVSVMLGGFDSAVIAAALVKLDKDVETFSFYFDDKAYNQSHTDTLSNYLGINHHWVRITPEVIKEGLSQYPYIFNQPSSQAHYYIQSDYTLGKIKGLGYRYCFTGDGCDELFLGYPTVYRRAKIIGKLKRLPKKLISSIRYILALPVVEDRLGYISRMIRNILLVLGRNMPARGFVANRIIDEYSLSRLMPDSEKYIEKLVEDMLEYEAISYQDIGILRLAYTGKSMVKSARNKMEGAALNNGVVMLSPFYDKKFRDFVCEIPESMLRPSEKNKQRAIGKYIFVEMARKYKLLPDEIILQKKASPVTSPVDYWYMRELHDYLIASLDSLPHKYNRSYIEKILSYKVAEDFLRKRLLGKNVMNIISILVTYSAYFQNNK